MDFGRLEVNDVGFEVVLVDAVDVLEIEILDDVVFLVVFHTLVAHLQVMVVLEQGTQHGVVHLEDLGYR